MERRAGSGPLGFSERSSTVKEYETLTREKVDVMPFGCGMPETHLMQDWSDRMLDLILNGPTINGIKKDEVRAILPVCEGLAGLGQLGGRALDVLALDADVEAVGAFFNHFGELAVVLLEYGLALRHAALGVDDLLLELFLCHGGLLSSWPGRSRGSWWCRVPEKQKHDRRIASESSAEGVRSSSIFSVGVV